jgi:hypothetical protein
MSANSVPLVLQAEAYCGDTYVLIRNSKTENSVEQTKQYVPQPICEAPDFAAFLEMTAGLVNGSRVLLTLGDSRTANFSNWPRAVALNHLRDSDFLVVNLADWARCCEEHVPVLEFYLDWFTHHGATSVLVAFIGGLTDMHSKLTYYSKFMRLEPYAEAQDDSTSRLLSPAEEPLIEHRFGAELARLVDELPTELEDVYRWIAVRILSIVKILDRLCREAGALFFAILEPNSYFEYSPAYERALRRAYANVSSPIIPFEAWCQQHRYSRNPSAFHVYDLRAILESLRNLWQGETKHSQHGHYFDWSGLFHDIDECCFDVHFDAVHYNQLGVRVIAKAIYDLVSTRGRTNLVGE